MKKSRGFTIVEIAVVIMVIAVLATTITVMFIPVQKQSRDKRRAADMIVFTTALEKYYDAKGEYPTDAQLASEITNNTVSGLIAKSSGSTIGASTTHAILKSEFAPNTDADFGDPLRTSPDTIFRTSTMSATKGANFQYLYLGGGNHTGNGTVNPAGLAVTFNAPAPTGTFVCKYSYTTTTNGAGSYLTGYFSETDQAFVLFQGRQGSALNWNVNNEARCPVPRQGN